MAFEGLSIGTSGLKTAQAALEIIGHNIANVNTEGYTRQRANVVDNTPIDIYPGQRGTGVHVDEVTRLTDNFTRLQIDHENRNLGRYSVQSDIMNEVEQVLNETSDTGLQNSMTKFFNSFQTLANSPEDLSTRNTVLQNGINLVQKFQSLSKQLKDIKSQTDDLVKSKVTNVNDLTQKIADLNKQISSAESREGQNANDLRDQRELLEKQLNKIMDITTYEDSNHNLFVETQGTVLVAGTKANLLSTTVDENGYLIPCNAMTQRAVNLSSGELKGVTDVRDGFLDEAINALDTVANSLITAVNRQHSKGSSLNGVDSMTGDVVIDNPNLDMIHAGFENAPAQGTLYLSVLNSATGDYSEQAINIDPYNQSVNDVITSINTAFGGRLTASLTSDNQFHLEAVSGYKIYFGQGSNSNTDTSDFLLATGTNTFFTGNSAFSIGIKDEIQNDLTMINAGQSLSAGDNTNALAIADIGSQTLMEDGTATLNDYFSSVVSKAGTVSQTASDNLDSQNSIVSLLEQRLSSTTGVSIDEEATNLLIYQRMYQASAKYISIMDSVMSTLIGLGG